MVYTPCMTEKTERANCRFVLKQTKDGKPQIVVERYQSIAVLKEAVLGFDLLNGTTQEQAKKVLALLNENVLNIFVTANELGAVSGS
jgi:23S rRNA G2069 N7-methylase RlmK/C1962 C5-methylase RlmI